MQIGNAPRIQQFVTDSDLPSTDEANRSVDAAETSVHDARMSQLKLFGTIGAGTAVVAGVGMLMATRGSGMLHGAGIVTAIAAAAIGGVATFSTIVDYDGVRQAKDASDAAKEALRDVQLARAGGAQKYNAIASDLIAAYDHNSDGRIDLRSGQALETDERIRLETGGPAKALHDRVRDAKYYFEGADTDGNQQLDGREVALSFMHPAIDWQSSDIEDAFERRDPTSLESVGSSRPVAADVREWYDRDAADA